MTPADQPLGVKFPESLLGEKERGWGQRQRDRDRETDRDRERLRQKETEIKLPSYSELQARTAKKEEEEKEEEEKREKKTLIVSHSDEPPGKTSSRDDVNDGLCSTTMLTGCLLITPRQEPSFLKRPRRSSADSHSSGAV